MHEGAVPRTCQANGQGQSAGQGWFTWTLFKRPKTFLQSLHLMGMFPSAGHQGMEVAKELKEDAATGQSESRRCSHSRGRDKSRLHWIPPPQCASRCQSPSPSPPWSHHADKQLSHSMKNLDLQTRPCESKRRVQWSDAPTPAEEKMKKQVRFDVEGDLGDAPMLPQGLTLFLVEGMAEKWDDTPGLFTSIPKSSPQPPLEGPQHCPFQSQPFVGWSQSWPQSKPEEPDPVNQPHRWIHVEMEMIVHPLVEGT